MDTRIIGIDLAIKGTHKAIVLDQASNQFVSKLLAFDTDPAELDQVLEAGRAHTTADVRLMAVLEATGMAWYSVGVTHQDIVEKRWHINKRITIRTS